MTQAQNDRVITVVATSAGQTVFAYDFEVFASTHMAATFEDVSAGTTQNLISGTDFTVSGVGNDTGGNITLTGITVEVGDRITIFGSVPIERTADYQQSGDFLAEVVNVEEDTQIQILQELRRDVDRSVKTGIGEGETSFNVDPGQLLRLDPTENAIIGADPQSFYSEAGAVSFVSRNFLSASAAATLDDGTAFDMGGLRYKRDDAATGTGSATNDIGVDGIVPFGLVQPGHFGNPMADANFLTGAGTDQTALIDRWLAWLSANDVLGLLDGKYKYNGQIDVPSNIAFTTIGRDHCGFMIEFPPTQTGWVDQATNVRVGDFTISRNMTGVKTAPDSGHVGNVMRLGNYFNGAQTVMGGSAYGRIRLTEATVSNSTLGFGIYGNVDDVSFMHLQVDSPNTNGMAYGFQFHWSGNATTVGDPVTQTYHPRNIRIDELDMPEGVRLGGASSAANDVTIGKWSAKNLDRVLWLLAGDEVDDFASTDQGPIRRGLKIDQIFVEGTQTGIYTDLIQILGAGASKFRTDGANPLQQNMPMLLEIEQLTIRGSSNVNDAVSMQGVVGNVRIGDADITGINRYSLFAQNSRGSFDMSIKSDKEIRTRNVEGGDFKVNLDLGGTPGSFGVYMFSDDTTLTTSGTAASGATSITLNAGLAQRLVEGSVLAFGNVPIKVTSYSAVGDTTLTVAALPVSIPSGSTLTVTNRSHSRLTGLISGAGIGVRAIDATVLLDGINVALSENRGVQTTDSEVTIVGGQFVGNENYDVEALGASIVSLQGGRMGYNSNNNVTQSVNAEGTSRVIASGVSFGKTGTNNRRATTNAKFYSYGSIGSDGNLVPDANV